MDSERSWAVNQYEVNEQESPNTTGYSEIPQEEEVEDSYKRMPTREEYPATQFPSMTRDNISLSEIKVQC
jgi:hypothetical protein